MNTNHANSPTSQGPEQGAHEQDHAPQPHDNDRRQRRRRIADLEGDDEDDNAANGNTPGDYRNARAQRLARRAAQQRRVRQRQELLALAADDDDNDDPAAVSGGDNAEDNYDYAVEADDANGENEEEEEDGEDLMENAERDYQPIEELDHYDMEGIDDREYESMGIEERRMVESELNRRDTRNEGFYGQLDQFAKEEDEEARLARREMFASRTGPLKDGGGEELDDEEEEDDDLDGGDPVNLGAFDVPLREWIAQDRTRREIQRRFRVFLKHYRANGDDRRLGNGIYEQKIRSMCAANLSSLQVSYAHIVEAQPILALWLTDAPKDMLLVLNEAATRHTLSLFPSYTAIKTEIHVRVSDFPILNSLRDLRRSHLDSLVKVNGVVTRRSAVHPQLQLAYYQCLSCKDTQGPFLVENGSTPMPDACVRCERPRFKLHPTKSLYRNVQRLNLQETPGSVPPGRVPRTKEVLVADDLIDAARPGEEIEVTGVFDNSFDNGFTIKSGFPVFSTHIHANHIANREDASSASNMSETDIRQILDLSRDPRIGERIVKSIAPSIYGQEFCKMALAMSLFGGVPKDVSDKHRIRGDVNILLLGDPGTAKSQLLKYAEYTAPRAVYSTGKGASAVGLTASVHKDPITREWTLEGGALVLADKGVCLIDEFDKMNEQDRTSIHEAMEQQSISVSKAGIVTSLQARCAVIAAANPIGGRYDSANTLADNVELTDPILQRFDILCVLQDTVDPIADERLAKFVTGSHMRSIPTSEMNAGAKPPQPHPDNLSQQTSTDDIIPQDLLRKYIQYARTNIRPVLRSNTFDQEKVASLYVALRRESAASGGVPIAVRHVESMMRMAEAHAKMHLRDYVRDDDMDVSIRIMLESFIMAQKFSVRRALRRSFAKYITTMEDRTHLLLHILQDMFRKEQMYQILRYRQRGLPEESLETLDVPLDELEGKARERRIYDVSEFCRSEVFRDAGYIFDDERRIISRGVS